MALVIACVWVALAGLFTALMWLSTYVESEHMKENVRNSLQLLVDEGEYYRYRVGGAMLQKDNFTDATMVSSSMPLPEGYGHMRGAFANPMPFDRSAGNTCATRALAAIDDYNTGNMDTYSRYWCGFLVTLRPMLAMTELNTIRIVDTVILWLLALLATVMVWRRIGGREALFFIIAIMAVGFPVVPGVLQYFTCFFLMMLCSILVLAVNRKRLTGMFCGVVMFVTGAVTVYFDFLTTPVLTLGFPAIFILLRRDALPDWRMLLLCVICWGLGYFGLWATKWVISPLVSGLDIMAEAVNAAHIRAGGISEALMAGNAKEWTLLALVFMGLAAVLLSVIYVRRSVRVPQRVDSAMPIAVIALIPFIWVLALQNHSAVHYWFVWRIFSLTIFSILEFYNMTVYAKGREKDGSNHTVLQ